MTSLLLSGATNRENLLIPAREVIKWNYWNYAQHQEQNCPSQRKSRNICRKK